MIESNSLQLTINFTSEDSMDVPAITEELTRGLGEMAEVSLISQEIPEPVTRGLDAGMVFQIINVSFAGMGILLQLAKLLMEICQKKNSKLLILSNPHNGKTVIISDTDSLEKIEKKMSKLLHKEEKNRKK